MAAMSAAGAVGTSPTSLEWQTPGMGSDELMDGIWSPRSGVIETNRRRCLHQGNGNFPQPLDALGAREQRGVAAHRVQYQTLVRLQHIANAPGIVHGELH